MPWHLGTSSKCPSGKPVAVIKDADGSVAGCHPNKDSAKKQLAALYAQEKKSAGGNPMDHARSHDAGCVDCAHESGERAADNSSWDGGAAMSTCAKSSTPASCYSSICAGRKSGPPDQQSSWALPHHKSAGGPPNAAGVSAALGRLGQTQGLTNAAAARRHLEAHQGAMGKNKSADHDELHAQLERLPRENLVRGVFPLELREVAPTSDKFLGETLCGHFAVFDRWTEIDSFWEGRFMESIAPGSFTKTFDENRAGIRCLFQHGRDSQLGSQVLGPNDVLREEDVGAWYEVPLYRGIPDLLLNGLRDGNYGASFRFRVTKEEVNSKPDKSDYNPDGIPERTIKEVQLMEYGPVTFGAYADATAGIRSLTDDFILQVVGMDPGRVQDLVAHYAQRQAGVTALHQDGAELEPHSGDGAATSPLRKLAVIPNPNKGHKSQIGGSP